MKTWDRVEAGKRALKTTKKKYGPDFHAIMGAKGGKVGGAIGGKNGHTGGFYGNPEKARLAGLKSAQKRGEYAT